MRKLPLEGIRIIDSTYIFAMPYACGIMTDLGAEVIKIEGPAHFDPIRLSGAFADNAPDHDAWNRSGGFNQINRGKRSLTLDLSKEEGREALKELIKVSDVLVENYTPRVMRRWGLDYSNLVKIKPDIIMVSNTGYGHGDGPWSLYPAQATTQEATHGLGHITGYHNDIPSKAGHSYVDFLACWSALLGIASALRHRNKTGKGQWVDIGMYQLGCYWTSEYITDYIANGNLGKRMGNRHPQRAPQGCYPCAGDEQWCVISVGDDAEWAALCTAMGVPEMTAHPRFATLQGRIKHHDELDALITPWTKERDRYDVMERLQAAGVPAAPVYDARDCNLDPHLWKRGYLEKVVCPPDRKLGTRVFMGRPWQLSKTSVKITGPAPRLGEHNEAVLKDLLGFEEDRVGELEDEGILGTVPQNARRSPAVRQPDEDVRNGVFAYYDPDYKEKLNI
ncbi:MAG: CoA transferase [Chloroflexi bacterium]|nr:CoA transferase [Chloroflexota bacterium]